jgi:hypothetical protein
MPAGLDRLTQTDWRAGMFRGVRQEQIPQDGAYDLFNTLLNEDGGTYRRGGSSYRSTAAFGTALTFLWDGWLTGGQRTVIASPTALGLLNTDGSVTSLGGSGLSAPARAAAMNGVLYLPGGVTYDGTSLGSATKSAPFYAVVANRLIAAGGDRVDFSVINTPGTFNATDNHLLPGGIQILGAEGLRDSLAVFTTDGLWVISDMALNLTDAGGNVQHRLDQYSRDLILWGDPGIAAWAGGLIVPAVDAVWQVNLGVRSEAAQPFARISDPIRALYEDYVDRGYQPGLATVYRSHYLLPILSGTKTIDLLVCNLGSPKRPWSRLGGFGAALTGLAVRKNATGARDPVLIGASSAGRALNLSYFDPAGPVARDADGSAHVWSVTMRDVATGALNKNTVTKVRVGYELVDAGADNPTIEAYVLSGRTPSGGTEWGLFSWGQADWSPTAEETPLPGSATLTGNAEVDTFGLVPHTWPVRERERFIRFKFVSQDPAARLALKTVEIFVRSNGRL